ncbi:hypothetical protein L0F63_005310 [Massospora cicadina]|nr:hypothetical protein L0F63_005310 [Massospora cicadina]
MSSPSDSLMAIEAERKKQATLRQLFTKKSLFSKKKQPTDQLPTSIRLALPNITRDSFSDLSKLVESRFQQISNERFSNMPSIKAHHLDNSLAIDPETNFPLDIADACDNALLKLNSNLAISSMESFEKSSIETPSDSTSIEEDTSFRYLHRGKDLSKRQMKTKHCPPPLKLYNSTFNVAQLPKKPKSPSYKGIANYTAKHDTKDSTNNTTQVAVKDAVNNVTKELKDTKKETSYKVTDGDTRDIAKDPMKVVATKVSIKEIKKDTTTDITKAIIKGSTEDAKSDLTKSTTNKKSVVKNGTKGTAEKKRANRVSVPRKSVQTKNMRNLKRISRGNPPVKYVPKARSSNVKPKVLVIANPDCSDSEAPSLSSKLGCPTTDEEEEVKCIDEMKHATHWQEEDSTVQRFPLPPKKPSPNTTQELSIMSIDSTTVHEALNAFPKKEVIAKLTSSPTSGTFASKVPASEQVDFLLKKHTSNLPQDIAEEEGFDLPANVQLRYNGGNDIKIETHKVNFRHIKPTKPTLNPLPSHLALRGDGNGHESLTYSASLRDRRLNPPSSLSKKPSVARLVPIPKASEDEIATISKIVANTEKAQLHTQHRQPPTAIRNMFNQVRNFTRNNSTKQTL